MATKTKWRFSREVRELTTTLDKDDTSPTLLFTLPDKARIISWRANVRQAFSGGTATVSVGTEGVANYFVDGLSVAAVGETAPGTSVVKPGEELDGMTRVYAAVGAGNSEGSVELTCVFSIKQGTPIA